MSVQGGVVDGFAAPGWEGVRNAFENNFGLNQELGAQLVIYKDGILQADLCGRNEAAKATAYGQVFECSERETCLIKKNARMLHRMFNRSTRQSISNAFSHPERTLRQLQWQCS